MRFALKKRANHTCHSLLKINSVSSLFWKSNSLTVALFKEPQERFAHGRSLRRAILRERVKNERAKSEERKSEEQKSVEQKSEE